MSQQELELPRGWVETTIGESLILVNGRAFKPTEWSEDGLPIIRIQNLNNSKKDFNYCNFEVDKRFLIDDNDLLFSWSGTPDTSFGAFIWNRGKAILNQHIFKIIIIENKIDNNFLYYLLNYNVKQYVNKAHGTAGLAHITKGKFEESTLLLAPLNEQKRIVSKIEELFSKIDSTKQSLEHTKLQLEQYRYSLLRSVYSKCERKSLHTICKLISGQHILKEFCNDQKKGSFYITGPSDFGDRFPIISKWTTKPKVFGIKNDILVTVKGSGVGKLNILDQDDVCISRQLMAIRPINLKSLFVYYFLKNEFFTLQNMSKGDLPGIDRDAILKMLIGIASPKEQERIISQIEQSFSVLENTSQVVNSTLQNLQTMKMSILKQAFEGKLVPQDPNDEPAQMLLERIKSTKKSNSIKQRRIKNVK